MYDFAIIGAGVSGLAAAMYAARLKLKTVVFGYAVENAPALAMGGIITLTDRVENYPGFRRLTGAQLAKEIESHARSYDIEIKEEKVAGVEKKNSGFAITTESGVYEALTLLFATGTKIRRLDAKGAREFENRGISYCALCDAPFFKDETVAVVGGSDTAAKEALLLAEHAKKVYIIYRGEKIRPEPINAVLIEKNRKIEVITRTNVLEVKGEKGVEGVVLDRAYKGSNFLELQGVFAAIGGVPLSELAASIGVKVNERGEIKVNRNSETNIPGVFAAGDVTDTEFKQAITGVAQGVTASYYAYKFIKEKTGE